MSRKKTGTKVGQIDIIKPPKNDDSGGWVVLVIVGIILFAVFAGG